MLKTHFLRFANVDLQESRPTNGRALTRAEKARQRAYIEGARRRCREFRDLRYCACCHLALDVAHSFCEKCGTATEPLPTTYALEYARDEFPDLVESREDFDRLVG